MLETVIPVSLIFSRILFTTVNVQDAKMLLKNHQDVITLHVDVDINSVIFVVENGDILICVITLIMNQSTMILMLNAVVVLANVVMDVRSVVIIVEIFVRNVVVRGVVSHFVRE